MNESMLSRSLKIFGDKACHPERSEGSGEPAAQILRCAQDDMQDTARGRSLEIFSPNIYAHLRTSEHDGRVRLVQLTGAGLRERAELDQRADAFASLVLKGC